MRFGVSSQVLWGSTLVEAIHLAAALELGSDLSA